MKTPLWLFNKTQKTNAKFKIALYDNKILLKSNYKNTISAIMLNNSATLTLTTAKLNYVHQLFLRIILYAVDMSEGETPPPFGTQYSGGFKAVRSTQRASTQYATIPLNRTQRSKTVIF